MSNHRPVKLAILWHMHQPNYQEPDSNRMVMPWVRFHALKDYLDMPLIAGKYDDVRVTFNLVPSLLDQIELYLRGGTDRHMDLTRVKAEDLNEAERTEILTSFFSANPTTMIEPYSRYRELYGKARDSYGQSVLPAVFTSEELRDLQVWSNLCWIDPLFRHEEPIASLFDRGRHFTEDEKHELLDWQLGLMGRVIPAYKRLYDEGRIGVSFTPYYHPILPLLCDTDAALEAMPAAKLPQRRFAHPEDAAKQISMSIDRFESLFGGRMEGMWPSEGSVSEEVAKIASGLGIRWMATDEEVLVNSLRKSKMDYRQNPVHAVYDYGPGIRIFFRDHALSDRIGFVYSGWEADKAVDDFINHIKSIRSSLIDRIDDVVVSVILDGENAWEYFPGEGHEFLNKLYQRISDDPLIEAVTMTQAVEEVKPRPLPSLFAGSWINHNFRIWIGHDEDNAAWDLLVDTRDKLVEFQEQNPGYDKRKIENAWRQIYIAEGSDWCWWYGDEHRGVHNEQFDRVFRRHLMAVYENLGLEIPSELLTPVYRGEAAGKAIPPDALVTPKIDGCLSNFYEWSGAGYFDCLKAGSTMHRVDQHVSRIHFAFDHDCLYIRLDFVDRKKLELVEKLRLRLSLFNPAPKLLEFDISGAEAKEEENEYRYCLVDLMEIAVGRSYLFEGGFGLLGLVVTLFDDDQELESWPDGEPIELDIPEKDKELFWPA